jgi:PPM family protein phosphatase
MADRWFYAQGGQVVGPVPTAELMNLAAAGKLAPQDLVWPEGADRGQAVPVEAAVRPPAAPAAPKGPDWLGDVKAAEQAAPPPTPAPGPAVPDWLEDVRRAEQPAPVRAVKTVEVEVVPQVEPARPTPVSSKARRAEGPAGKAVKPAGPALLNVEGVEIIAPGRPCRLAVGAATWRGRVKGRNEDRFLVQQLSWSEGDASRQVSLLAVVDGRGDHWAGEEAAGVVVRTVGRALGPALLQALEGEDRLRAMPRLIQAIDGALQEANKAVAQRAELGVLFQGMGATAAVVLVWDDVALVRHVGDCRVYHQHGERLRQLTQDQTLAMRLVELGQMSQKEAARHPSRTEVTQAIGQRAPVEPGRSEVTLTRGDCLIVCTDGLYPHVNDAAVEKAVNESLQAADLADQLVTLAGEGGGGDNCTVVVAFYH